MSKTPRLLAIALLAGLAPPLAAAAQEIAVWRSPSCGCCHLWAKQMGAFGMRVKMTAAADLAANKKERGVPPELASCHTALVEGYAIEGHVPAREIWRLLAERPDAIGLVVPGMPAGSPGMEFGAAETYQVLLFKKDGSTEIFARYP